MAGKQQLEDRRRTVWDLVVRGIPMTVIAKTLGVHRNTINNDVKVLRENNRKQVSDIDVKTEIGDAVAKFDNLFMCAMNEFSTAEKTGAKCTAISLATNALDRKVRFLMDVGFLPKAAQEFSGKVIVEGVDVQKASSDELRGLRNRLLQRMGQSVDN